VSRPRPGKRPAMDLPASIRRSWRAWPLLLVALATLAGAVVTLSLYQSDRDLSTGTVRLSVDPAHPGALDIYVPLVDWGARFHAVKLPARLKVEARTVDSRAIERVASGRVDVERLQTEARDAIEAYIRRLVVLVAGVALVLGALVVLGIFLVTRTRWRPAAPLRLATRRSWGQILSASARMYVTRPRVFLGIGLLLIPLGLVITLLQALLLGGFGLLGVSVTGEAAGGLVLLVVGLGTVLALLGLVLVQAATVHALVEIDAGRDTDAVAAYRAALAKLAPLLRGLVVGVAVWVLLSTTAFLLPVAVWLIVRWLLFAQVVVLEERPGFAGLHRSAQLVRRHWLRVASLVGIGGALALAIGPFLGALLIIVTEAPLALLNVVAGVFYALAMPFVALVTSYVYFDARARHELAEETVSELPAEFELAT